MVHDMRETNRERELLVLPNSRVPAVQEIEASSHGESEIDKLKVRHLRQKVLLNMAGRNCLIMQRGTHFWNCGTYSKTCGIDIYRAILNAEQKYQAEGEICL